MKFLERIFQPKKIEGKESVRNVHPDFKITHDNFWYTNKDYSPVHDGRINLKAVFKFEDPRLLDNCPFVAKIGMNESDGPKYFGVAYGSNENRAELENWAKKFPWAHLILDLDKDGAIVEGAREIDLNL